MARAAARTRRDWAEADRLRAEIEAAGWRVVDYGSAYELEPASPPDEVVRGTVRHGTPASVPSRLAEPAIGSATVMLLVGSWSRPPDADRVARVIDAHRRTMPADTTLLVIADAPDETLDPILDEAETDGAPTAAGNAGGVEVLRTAAPLGFGASLDLGLRRATAPIIVVADGDIEPTGDLTIPMGRALDDPRVAIVGIDGFDTRDLRRFEPVESGPVTVVGSRLVAFRRVDAAVMGAMDAAFRGMDYAGPWLSLVLRDGGPGGAHRVALAVGDLPIERVAGAPPVIPGGGPRSSDERREFYRLFDRFGRRVDLLVGAATDSAYPNTGEARDQP